MAGWLFAFAATLAIETPIVVAVLPRPVPIWRRVCGAVAASTITHPVFWFVARRWFTSHDTYVTVSELVIVIVEAFVLWIVAGRPSPRRAFAASALANGASYLASVLWALAR